MEDNPYSKFISVMQDTAGGMLPAVFRFGTVVTANPLSVDIGGALQTQDALVFATPSPFVEVEVDMTTLRYDCIPEVPHNHIGITEDHNHTARVTRGLPTFQKGDKLLLIPIEEEQRYIVLSRLVGL